MFMIELGFTPEKCWLNRENPTPRMVIWSKNHGDLADQKYGDFRGILGIKQVDFTKAETGGRIVI